MRVGRHLVAGLAAAAPAVFGDLRVSVRERERGRLKARGFAQPRLVAVDLEPERAKEPGLAKVIPGQRFIIAAITARVHDEQRRPFPGAQGFRTNQGDRHRLASRASRRPRRRALCLCWRAGHIRSESPQCQCAQCQADVSQRDVPILRKCVNLSRPATTGATVKAT